MGAVSVAVAAERSGRAWIGISVLLFVAAACILPFVGPTTLDMSRVWTRQEPDWSILTNLRLSRTLLGLLAGGALALAGSLFQSMLRDALATPYTLGVSTGAVKTQITKGPWPVRAVLKVDETSGQIWFSASGMYPGRDPYFLSYYRINFDGTGLTRVSGDPETNHAVSVSSDRQFIVDL